jgi:hypothetical protein
LSSYFEVIRKLEQGKLDAVCLSFGESEAKRCSSAASIVSPQEKSTRHCFSEEIRETSACVSECESHPVEMP